MKANDFITERTGVPRSAPERVHDLYWHLTKNGVHIEYVNRRKTFYTFKIEISRAFGMSPDDGWWDDADHKDSLAKGQQEVDKIKQLVTDNDVTVNIKKHKAVEHSGTIYSVVVTIPYDPSTVPAPKKRKPRQ